MDLQKLMNDLLTLKTHAESVGMSSKEIAKMPIVEEVGYFNELFFPEIEFELGEDKHGKRVILMKKTNSNQKSLR